MFAVASSSETDFVSLDIPLWAWGALVAGIAVLLVADLLIVHRRPHAVSFREAAIESAVWISLGLAFALVVGLWHGGGAAGECPAGYPLQESSFVGKLFPSAAIFSHFSVSAQYPFPGSVSW